MSLERAKTHLEKYGLANRIMIFDSSSATVDLAAKAAGTEPDRIAKTMSFDVCGKTVLIVTSGKRKINNGKYKETFGTKAKMLPFEEVEARVGHAVGGVCPFGVNPGVEVYLDVSLKAYETVFPACGEHNNAIELSIEELEKASCFNKWVDVCGEIVL